MNNIHITIFLCFFFEHYSHVLCYSVTCNFEESECGWELNSVWQIYPSGSTTETANSGPTADHTTGSGNYVRFMAALLSDSNKYGIMSTSACVEQSTSFSFWYFMHGSQIGTLALIVNDQVLWEKSGRQGVPAWHQANITLPAGVDVNITFSANRTGIGRSSDIAIDDIVLQGESMSFFTRTTRPRPSTTPRIRFNASCDFDVEREICSWKNDTTYGWKVIHTREPNITIGPLSDYSSIMRANDDNKVCNIPYDEKGPQYYCILNSRRLQCKGSDNKWINCRDGGFLQIRSGEFDKVGESSQIESPVLDALSEEGCVQFQYNIAGSDNDWLNVYTEDYWSGRQSCMWHKNGSTVPNRWVTAEAPLKPSFIVGSGTYPIEACSEEMIINTSTMINTEQFETTATEAMATIICTVATPSTMQIAPSTVAETLESIIESNTTFESNTTIEPNTTIELNLTFASNTTTESNTITELNTTIKSSTAIELNTTFESNTTIKSSTTIKSNTTIELINTTIKSNTTTELINTTAKSTTTIALNTTIVSNTAIETNTTNKVTTATSYDGEQNKTTISTSGTKDTPILAIILGVLGGTILVSAVVGVFIWHSSILSRLGIKRSNRITMTSTY
ncbi:unnamed protein product [Rotaria sp. Silwood2]|nr:unnamed protein product [Rotaria sp. Silwood2]CAF4271693.1 unnamed protein product [Rotaria sp. Silwood2]CAF4513960.1 unnamed protein product [Rotaria sp. Silwood2]